MTEGRRRSSLRRALAAVAAAVIVVVSAPVPASADEVRDGQWHLGTLRVPELHRITRGEGVTVCVVDSGVWPQHPDLTGQVLRGLDWREKDGRGHTARDWSQRDGHGTSMAATIAGHGHGPGGRDGILGLAPGAKILPMGRGAPEYVALEMGDELRYCVDHGASVINLSYGVGADFDLGPQYLSGLRYAVEHDAVVVAATGNDGGPVSAPANLPGIVAVGAVDRRGRLWYDSNRGPQVALTAPGELLSGADTRWPDDPYRLTDGTSHSSAIVSGVAALIRARYPDATAAEVVNRMTVTARDAGPRGRDPGYGYGAVDPYAALTEDVPPPAANPVGTPPPAPPPPPEANFLRDTTPLQWAFLGGVAAVSLLVVVALVGWGVWYTRRQSGTSRA